MRSSQCTRDVADGVEGASAFGRSRVASLRDLEVYVNHPTAHWSTRRPPWSVKLLPNFGNEVRGRIGTSTVRQTEESACSLAIIEMQSTLADHLCPLRFISLWTGGFVSFDSPAQTNTMLAHNNQPPYNMLLSFSTFVWTACQVGEHPVTMNVDAGDDDGAARPPRGGVCA